MKNQKLVEDGENITVDYSKFIPFFKWFLIINLILREDKKDSRSRKRLNDSNNSGNNEDSNKRVRPSTPSPSSSPSRAGHFENIEQLKEAVACTWKGLIQLKKVEYPLRLNFNFLFN